VIRLGISVEGQTEERFVKDILAAHLHAYDIDPTPIIVATSRSASGKKAKGGGINLDRVANELRKLLGGYPDGYVTSLYDFYGFEDKDPGETVEDLEGRIAARLGSPRNFISYVQLHEFEGLLFSDGLTTATYFEAAPLEALIIDAVERAGSPENVNDNPQTAPSKRLELWTSQYAPPMKRYSKSTKTLHSPALAARLTLPTIRAACPRFNRWLQRLEALGGEERQPPAPQ
jgi:hypothetical protein